MALDLKSVIQPVAIRGMLAREWVESRVTYNPLDSRFHQDPYPKYAALRRKDRVHWSRLMQGWVLSWHEDVDAVLRDHRHFANDERNAGVTTGERDPEGRSMLVLDPPDHTRLRGLVSKAFTPRAIEAIQPRIRQIVDEILEGIPDGVTFDVMDVLAYPLPTRVIAEMLGVPPEDQADFKRWSDAAARTLEPTISTEQQAEADEADQALEAYFRRIIAERRNAPREDLLSALIAAEEAGDSLTEREMLNTLALLLVAGNETTTNLIGNGLRALLHNPGQLQLLRDDPTLAEAAVEELLRFDSPVQTDGRTAIEDVEIGGQLVRRGEGVYPLIGSANRDPRAFERPRELDITRGSKAHLAFGRGIHHCLGAPLARMEGRIAFEALTEQFRVIELAGSPPRYKDQIVLRGLRGLEVRVWRS